MWLGFGKPSYIPSTHKRHIKRLQGFHPTGNITLVKQPDKPVKDTLNYQNYCKNTLWVWVIWLQS